MVLLHPVAKQFSREYPSMCTIYTTDEPCPMRTGAIYWSGIGKLVFGLRKSRFYEVVGRDHPEDVFEMSCRELLKHGGRKVEIVGPVLEDEVIRLHVEQ